MLNETFSVILKHSAFEVIFSGIHIVKQQIGPAQKKSLRKHRGDLDAAAENEARM